MTDAFIHQLVTTFLFPALVVFTSVVAYVFGIRPALRQNPKLKTLYETEDTIASAVRAKLSGLKQKLMTIVLSAVGFVVVAHDSISPLLAMAGIDPVALGSQILPKVPAWAWPVITLAALWLIQYFRNLADQQARANAEALLNAGHSLAAPAPGIPQNTLPSPSPLAALPDKKD